jgi:drug/metabolite transporter (DMT)-like permease
MAKDVGSLAIEPAGATANGGWGAIGLLSLVSLIWGAIFPLTNIAVHGGLTPITVATARILLAAFVLLVFSILAPWKAGCMTLANLRRLTPIAILLFVIPYTLMAWSQYYISSALAVIILATIPLLTALLWSISRSLGNKEAGQFRRGAAHTLISLLPGFAGIVLLMGESALQSNAGEFIGLLAAIATSASCAKAILLMSRLPPLPTVFTSTSICVIAAMILTPICLAIDQPWSLSPSAEGLTAVLLLGIICTGLSSTLYMRLTSHHGAVFASLSFYLSPISGLALSAMLLGENIGGSYLLAITLVLISVYLVSPPGITNLFRRGTPV